MKSYVIFIALALSLLIASIASAILCPGYWGSMHYFYGTHPNNQNIAYANAEAAADAWCAGYICEEYRDLGCELVWQGSMRVIECGYSTRRCIY